MPKHKKTNTSYLITLKVNTVCQGNFATLYHIYYKREVLSKNYTKTATTFFI